MLNRPVDSDRAMDKLEQDIDWWESQVIKTLERIGASEADISSFRTLITYPLVLGGRDERHAKRRSMLAEKLDRLKRILGKLENLAFSASPQSGQRTRTAILRDPDGQEWILENIVDASDEAKRRLMRERPDVWEAYLREISNRMGPPGEIGQPWPDPPIVKSESFVDQVKRQSATWRAQSYTIVRPDGTREVITAGHLLDLPVETRHRLLEQYPELGRWWRGLD